MLHDFSRLIGCHSNHILIGYLSLPSHSQVMQKLLGHGFCIMVNDAIQFKFVLFQQFLSHITFVMNIETTLKLKIKMGTQAT